MMLMSACRSVSGVCVLTCGLMVAAPAGADTIVFSDDFADGNRDGWYKITTGSQESGLGLEVVNDSAFGDHALHVLTSGSAGNVNHVRRAVAVMDRTVTLADPGDWIRLAFDFRVLNDPPLNVANHLRIGLFGDHGFPVTEDRPAGTPTDNHTGYFVRFSTGNQTGLAAWETGVGDSFLAGPNAKESLGTQTTLLDDTDVHAGTFELSVTDTSAIRIAFLIDGTEQIVRHDYASLQTMFNEIGLYTSAGIAIALDNVIVTSNVPEPAGLALLGLGAIGIAARRRP